MKIITNSFEETYNLGFKMGQLAQKGEVYCLDGDLGVGKTVFAKGFAKGLDVEDDITSPTFNIVLEYEGRVSFFHFDVYRITDICELDNFGFYDYIDNQGVCLIEWSSIIESVLHDTVKIVICKDLEKGDDYREVVIQNYDKEL